jgi:hypothetical protein
VPVETARTELEAHQFKRRADLRDKNGEHWAHPSGWPIFFLQYIGLDRRNFDRDQLEHVLSQGGPFRPGATIGANRPLN